MAAADAPPPAAAQGELTNEQGELAAGSPFLFSGVGKTFSCGAEAAFGKAGARCHAIAEPGALLRDIAAVIRQSPAQAAEHFGGWSAHFVAIDLVASSARRLAELGWTPTRPGTLADLDQPNYFKTRASRRGGVAKATG